MKLSGNTQLTRNQNHWLQHCQLHLNGLPSFHSVPSLILFKNFYPLIHSVVHPIHVVAIACKVWKLLKEVAIDFSYNAVVYTMYFQGNEVWNQVAQQDTHLAMGFGPIISFITHCTYSGTCIKNNLLKALLII